jgi:iron complex outermembrane recepter protein
MKYTASLAVLAFLDLAGTAPLMAQTAPETPATQTAEAAPADANTGLGEIVVTATKRETNLQRTPISISVLSSDSLKQRQVQSLLDLADGGVPSLRITTFEARQSALTIGIRGIVPLDANQPAREQGVGIYIDGIYLGRQHGLNAALFDAARIEVLKGPQGTLFGRNTEGGALSIVARAPTGEFGGRATAGISNLGGYNADMHIDFPEVYNVSFKADGVIQYQGPVTKNPLAGQTGFGYFDRRGLRLSARWKPTSSFTADLAYDNGYDANSPFYSQLLNVNPNGCVAGAQSAVPGCTLPGTAFTALTGTVKPISPLVVVNGQTRMRMADIGVPQQPSIDKTHGYTAIMKWKVSPDIELRSLTAWRGVNATQWDNSGGAHRPPVVTAPVVVPPNTVAVCTGTACNFSRYSLANLQQNQFSQEFQLVGSTGPVDYVGGLYYFIENVADDAATPNSLAFNPSLTAVTVLDPCTGSGGFGSQPGCRSIDRASQVRSRSYAVYGQATWNINDAIHLTAGGRYTKDKKQGELLFSRNINYRTNPAAAAAAGYKPLNEEWSRFNPMVTLAYDASENVHVYAKYATGYRAGGASSRTSNYQPFDPEDVKSYEIGLKTDLFDHRARFNLAGYIMDRKDSQVDISSIQFTSTGSFNNLVTINAPGNTKIRGIEADLTVNPLEGLTLNASYAFTYTNIPLVPITVTAGGVTTTVQQQFYIVFTPRNALSGSVDYSLPINGNDTSLRFHLDANYAQATQSFDQFATKNDSSFIVNGRLSVVDIPLGENSNKLTVAAWVRNMFDTNVVYRRDPSNSLPGAPTTNALSGSINNVIGDYGNFNMPRTFGLQGTIAF